MTVAELKKLPKDQQIPFEEVFLLFKVNSRKAKTGTPFLAVELGDRTGKFHVALFQQNDLFEQFSHMAEGTPLRIEGYTAHYQNRFSPKISNAEVIPEQDQADLLENLVESTPEDIDSLRAELEEHRTAITHEPLRETVRRALEEIGEPFFTTPAAIAMHHAYRGGLLEHTVRMARAARALLPLYPEVDANLALAGILLHDIGKVTEYRSALATGRTRTGILQGHVVLGYRAARKAAIQAKLDPERRERLEHIILSHQGEPEWGAAVRAATPEAVFTSMVDNLDAKMGMVQHALRSTDSADEFSELYPGLGQPVLVAPLPDEVLEPDQPELSHPND